MTYQIEKGVPLPAGKDDTVAATLAKMGVGDSVLDMEEKTSRVQAKWYGAARRNNFKVTIRKLKDGGHRVWRTE